MVFGNTTAIRERIMCADVVAVKILSTLEASGYDPTSKEFLGPGTLDETMTQYQYKFGCDMLFSMGQRCKFEGKMEPCIVAFTKNGPRTSALLVLGAIYLLGVFQCGVGLLNSFLLCDGYGSRFDYPFREYINNQAHKWYTCIGKPVGTKTHHTRDSEQQNGPFNIELGNV
jgi:hypothetical protein